eukprot:Hpha_TRINITY_DN13016_c0_g1::TRINITY_DN13016_c0_g1_i1::g.68852::m.68852
MTSPRIHHYNTARSDHWKRWVKHDNLVLSGHRQQAEMKERLWHRDGSPRRAAFPGASAQGWRPTPASCKHSEFSGGGSVLPPLPHTAPSPPRGSQLIQARPAPPPRGSRMSIDAGGGTPWAPNAALCARRPPAGATPAPPSQPPANRPAPRGREPRRLGVPLDFFRCAESSKRSECIPLADCGSRTTVVRDHLGQLYSFYE